MVEGTQRIVDPRLTSVWHRRPAHWIDESVLHPADREFAEGECRVFRRGFLHLLAPDALWVNPVGAAARAAYKPVQQQVALDEGLEMPATLFSNSPEQIRAFLRRQGGEIVFKPLYGTAWSDAETVWMPYTTLLTEELLVDDEPLRAVPGIYQAIVPKAYELRVTAIGDRLFAAKLRSQETRAGKLDWRKSYSDLVFEPYQLPEAIAARCRAVMKRLGLVYGAIDLIVTPDGRYVFLEVNQMGQFLFVEWACGMPVLDAFAELLLQGRPDYAWDPDRVTVRYPEVEEAAVAAMARAAADHVVVPDKRNDETRLAG
jgi:glutathione synthase/RimK-type ligase-like ATP-grasp enzyme